MRCAPPPHRSDYVARYVFIPLCPISRLSLTRAQPLTLPTGQPLKATPVAGPGTSSGTPVPTVPPATESQQQ